MQTESVDVLRPRLPDRLDIERDLAFFLSTTGVPAIGVDINIAGVRLNVAVGELAIGEGIPLTDGARFRISCLVKFFCSLVTLKLAEAGALDIDAPIGKYLPELGTTKETKGGIILVRHLLTHTSGYRSLNILDGASWRQWSWEACVSFLEMTPQLFEPGAVFNETHFDHLILGKILNRITGRLAPELIREHIFEPLGIEAGTAAQDLNHPGLCVYGHKLSPRDKILKKVENPGGRESDLWASSLSDITLTVRDMATIGAALARIGAMEAFSPEILNSLGQLVVDIPRTLSTGTNANWKPQAFNLTCAHFAGGQAGYLAIGKGQNCAIIVDQARSLSVAIALNAATAKVRAAILDRIFERIFTVPMPLMRDDFASSATSLDFDNFVGQFQPRQLNGRYIGCFAEEMIVAATPNRIDVTLGRDLKIALIRLPDNCVGVQARAPVPIGIFSEPASRTPAIMLGMYAFKKVG